MVFVLPQTIPRRSWFSFFLWFSFYRKPFPEGQNHSREVMVFVLPLVFVLPQTIPRRSKPFPGGHGGILPDAERFSLRMAATSSSETCLNSSKNWPTA